MDVAKQDFNSNFPLFQDRVLQNLINKYLLASSACVAFVVDGLLKCPLLARPKSAPLMEFACMPSVDNAVKNLDGV